MENLKQKEKIRVIGLMSGTSCDGLDICYAEIQNPAKSFRSRVLKFSSCEYSVDFKAYLADLPKASAPDICEANFKIAREWSKLIKKFIIDNEITDLDLIGSHGQTIWHIHQQATLQIGEASVLANDFNIPVIADFRVMDIAAGGSGAPLVPFVDYLWFKEYQKTFLLLNIGGIANFTIVPANCKSINDVYALDSGPGNGLIDAAVSIYSDGKVTYDVDSKYALQGEVNENWLNALMQHEYLSKPLPKSTGKEEFGENFIRSLINEFDIKSDQQFFDFIATLTRFTAESIHYSYTTYFKGKYSLDEIVVCGGGAFNPLLMKWLKELFSEVKFETAEKYNIDVESKEAHAFAVLAALRLWGIPANVPNVTGANKTVLLGKIIES